jgi:hypothetical protein
MSMDQGALFFKHKLLELVGSVIQHIWYLAQPGEYAFLGFPVEIIGAPKSDGNNNALLGKKSGQVVYMGHQARLA